MVLTLWIGHIALERFLHANLLSSAQYTTAAEIQDSEAILERKSIAKVSPVADSTTTTNTDQSDAGEAQVAR
jgi:hypothetical protein